MSRNHLNVLTARALVALPGGAGTVSEAVLALRYGRPLILFGPREAFHAFPAELERTESLERVCAFLEEAAGGKKEAPRHRGVRDPVPGAERVHLGGARGWAGHC